MMMMGIDVKKSSFDIRNWRQTIKPGSIVPVYLFIVVMFIHDHVLSRYCDMIK